MVAFFVVVVLVVVVCDVVVVIAVVVVVNVVAFSKDGFHVPNVVVVTVALVAFVSALDVSSS